MTQTISAPIDLDTATTATELACPDFCDDTCPEWGDPGDRHHTSGFATVTLSDRLGDTDMDVVVSRTDKDGIAGPNIVSLHSLDHGLDLQTTAAQARQLAALLLNAADLADPLPLGVLAVQAQHVRIGDQIRTEDGWQNVTGQYAHLASEECSEHAAVWTDSDTHGVDSDGWKHKPTDVVIIRRRVHGSAAIAFVEPIR
jgi:hypothetical protein